MVVQATYRVLGARALCMVLLGLASPSLIARPAAKGSIVWRDAFADGHPRAGDWSRCAQPYDSQVGSCAPNAAGPGEQIYWNPELLRGGTDPVRRAPGGGMMIAAERITDAQRQLVAAAVARQKTSPNLAAGLARAGWTSGWLQTRRSFGIDTTVRARLRPGAGASSWSGLWLLNDPAHRRWPPEIDVAEVTNNPDGSMYIRQAIHYRDAAGKLQSHNCPTTLPRRDWIVAAVTRLPDAIRFELNGKEVCTLPLPPGMGDPMQIILSQQVGGLAKPTTTATATFALEVAWVEVGRN